MSSITEHKHYRDLVNAHEFGLLKTEEYNRIYAIMEYAMKHKDDERKTFDVDCRKSPDFGSQVVSMRWIITLNVSIG